MKDILGNDLEIGDKVVFGMAQTMRLHTGEIIKISTKTVKIKHEVYQNGWQETTESQRAFEDVVKINS